MAAINGKKMRNQIISSIVHGEINEVLMEFIFYQIHGVLTKRREIQPA